LFRRPLFFRKTFTSIVAQGIYGGDKIVVYLDFVGNGLGFTVKGSCFTALEPMTGKEKQKIDRALARQSKRLVRKATLLERIRSHPGPIRQVGGQSRTQPRLQSLEKVGR
jgi:hypothetical protein